MPTAGIHSSTAAGVLPADVRVTSITPDNSPALQFFDLRYDILVENVGAGPADDVVLEFTYDATCNFVSSTNGGTDDGTKVTVNLGTIAPAATTTVTIVVNPQVSTETVLDPDIRADAAVSTSSIDTNGTNDSLFHVDEVWPLAFTVDTTKSGAFSGNLTAPVGAWDYGDGSPIDVTVDPSHTYADGSSKTARFWSSNKLDITYLDLSGQSLTAQTGILALTNLTQLRLQSNSFSGTIDVSALTNLTLLYLYNNSFSGTIDVSALTSLTRLYLYNNSFSGAIDVSALTNLTLLRLDGNLFSGTIDVSALTSLTLLYLQSNSFSGTIDVSALTNLTQLRLQSNSFSGTIDVSALTNLADLWLYNNSFSGTIDVSALTNLSRLYLYNNSFSGAIDVSALTNLTLLYLQSNSFSGTIDVSALTNLTQLRLDGNSFSDFSGTGQVIAATDIQYQSNSLLQSVVSGIINDIYINRAAFAAAAKSLDISGSNATPDATALTQIADLELNFNWTITH